jgi:hypothetical protein
MELKRIGLFGASGYAGCELITLRGHIFAFNISTRDFCRP